MTLTVKLFGMLKGLLGGESDLTVTLDSGARVHDLIIAVQRLNPQVGDLLLKKKVLVSVNQEMAHGDLKLTGSDEIAFLPPFAGGAETEEGTQHVHR